MQRVLGIDRFAPPHRFGSSHGETRITRLACGEGPEYTQFSRRSHEIWRELERQTDKTLLVPNGALIISGEGPRSANHENADFLGTTIEAAERPASHTRCCLTPNPPAPSRFQRPRGRSRLLRTGSRLRPSRNCIGAQLEQAAELGAEIHINEAVSGFNADGGVEVATDRATYTADKSRHRGALAARHGFARARESVHGPPSGALLVQAQAGGRVEDYNRRNSRPTSGSTWPSVDLRLPLDWRGHAYDQDRDRAIRYIDLGRSVDRTVTEDKRMRCTPSMSRPIFLVRHLSATARRCASTPVLIRRASSSTSCRTIARVIVASPCSGHGFKHSAGIGEALADLAINGKPARRNSISRSSE